MKKTGLIGFKNGVIVLFGLGDGNYVEALLANTENTRIMVYEPRSHRGYNDPRVVVFHSPQEFKQKLAIAEARKYRVRLAVNPVYKKLYREHYDQFCDFLLKELSAIQSDIVTSLRFSYEWQRNTFLNWRHIPESPPVARLFNSWVGKPIVVVSAGPSLDRDLDELRKVKDKVVILAVGSILNKLLREGIRPDYTLAFDGGWPNYTGHFQGVESDVPLIWDGILHWRILDEYKGPKVMMQIWPLEFLGYLGRPVGFINIGPSIANTVFDLALKMGGSPIILMGQDCAFTDGRSHADGAHLYRPVINHEGIDVPGVGGGTVKTSRTMAVFVHCFAWRISESNATVINTARGARIPGTIEMPAKDVFSQLPEVKKDSLNEMLFSELDWNIPSFINYLEAVRNHADKLLSKLDRVDLSKELTKPQFLPFAFAFQGAITSNEAVDTDKQWAQDETRQALEYCLPYLDKCLEELKSV